jgi:type II secretory pathway pseudopilin PulG
MIRLLRRDDGTSLIETTTVVAILGMVLALLVAILSASQNQVERNISRSSSNDEVRLAAYSIDREVRSGNVLYDPAQEAYAPGDILGGMAMRIYTQSNATLKCVQWRVTAAQELQRRAWDPNWQSDPTNLVTAWNTVATGIRNRADAKGAAFSLPSSNLLTVDIWANNDPNAVKGKAVNVKASVSGRNTIAYTSNAQQCGPAVPDPALTGTGGSRVPPY